MEFLIQSFPQTNEQTPPGPDGFTGEFYQTFRKHNVNLTYILFQKIKEDRIFPNSFYEVSINQIPKPDKNMTRKNNFGPYSL